MVSTSSASLYCTLEEPIWTCLDRRARGTISQVTYFPQFKQLPILLSTRTIHFNHWHTETRGWTPYYAMDTYNSWRSMPRISYRWMSEPTHYPWAVNTDGQTLQTKQSGYLLNKKLIAWLDEVKVINDIKPTTTQTRKKVNWTFN